MDSLEDDVSARVLLKNVLHTETRRSPVTSVTPDHPRRSSRIRRTPGLESPHVTLRHKLKQKLHESATQSPLQPSKRARLKGKAVKTPAVTSPVMFDEDITTRGLLKGIIQTESEASLLVSGQPGLPEENLPDVEASTHNRISEGGSGLELPDLATEPLSHIIKGLSRRRPAPNFNVSAFERKLDSQSDEGEDNTVQDVNRENTYTTKEHDLSDQSKSVLSLTLKTPFVSIRSERAGLQRKAARRKQPSVDAFDEAVQNHLEKNVNQNITFVQDGKTLGDSEWHKFTLGLSNISVPELTTDIVMSNTELYAQPSGPVSEFKEDVSQVATMGTHKTPSHQQQDPKPAFQSQHEEDEEIISSSKETDMASLSPEEMALVPTQPMVNCVPQFLEKEAQQSVLQEPQIDEIESREDMSHAKLELVSRIPRPVRRAYNSEGEPNALGLTARGRATKSLGARLDPKEKEMTREDADMDDIELKEGASLLKENLSTLSRKLSRRAYSEGGSRKLEVIARDRGTKSLGTVLRATVYESSSDHEETEYNDGECVPNEDLASQTSRQLTQTSYSSGAGDIVLGGMARQRGTSSPGEELDSMGKEISRTGLEMDDPEFNFTKQDLASQTSKLISRRAYNSEGRAIKPGVTHSRGTKSLGAGPDHTDKDLEVTEEEQELETQEKLASKLPSQMTRRDYNSEGGAIVPGVMARGRETRSLGAGLQSAEKDLKSNAGDHYTEDCDTLEEEPHISPALLSFNSLQPCSPGSHQNSLAQVNNDDMDGVHDNALATPGHLTPAMSPLSHEESNEDEDAEFSDELNMKTPAFIRQRKKVATPGALGTPTVLKDLNTGHAKQMVKPRPKQKQKSVSDNVLPKSYIMSVFKHFAKTKVASDVYPVINEILQKYFDRLADDLAAYSAHARRKTIEVEDVELLMRRQGFVTDSTPVNVLIEKLLPLEYRKLLIPVATSGNKVIPNPKR